MPLYRDAISSTTVPLPRAHLARMLRLVRALYRLGHLPEYRMRVHPELPEVARYDPGHDSVMMGYDFHLTAEGPRLIEVNTNAGGGLLAYLALHPDAEMARAKLPGLLRDEFLASFRQELSAQSRGARREPRRIAILDERPREQFLYEEMSAFRDLFEEAGIQAVIVDPSELDASAAGVLCAGETVDLVYNRHCDFYLERPEMAGLKAAYLSGNVCLTPNPFAYGLLADKRRMILWSDPRALEALGLDDRSRQLLGETIPESRLLSDLDREEVWASRSEWVFKPVSRFGSRGVFLGRKISRARFDQLLPRETLCQREVPPSLTEAGEGDDPFKTDLRLFVYRDRTLGLTARLYHGQVTNLRTAGGGFAPVRVV